MLRVTTIYASSAGSAAAYYTKYLADSPGEIPGRWLGRQADAFGLSGEVSGDDLLAVLEGRDPLSGSRLGMALVDRPRRDGTVQRAVAGFDATFSAPKSLSVVWALTGDERLLEAHDVAVRAALAHLERFGATTRVRVNGNRRLHPDVEGLTMAAFRQTTSRADDPQLHTHVVISSKVNTGGRWLALDARYLKRHQRMLGGLYQSVLRNELTHRLGVAWNGIEHGQAELAGVPAELCEVFSKRSTQVEAAVAVKRAEFIDRQGRDPNQWELAALKREAAADTRSAKTGSGVGDLTARWTVEAAGLGWTGPDLHAAAVDAGRDQPAAAPTIGVDEVVGVLSTGGSTWTRADIVSALCDLARPNPNVDGQEWAAIIERVSDQVIGRCVDLDPTDTQGPRRRSDGRSLWIEPTATHITSEPILREEELVLAWALDAQTDDPRPSPTVDTRRLDVLQADAARAVAGQDRLVLVVGPSGAGKTTTLRAAVDDLDRHARVVFGVAPSAKAARVLEAETGVPADTLAKLLHEWTRTDRPPERRYHLPAGATILLDEAGMVATPALAHLTTLAAQQQWRLALIGDPHQLQAVGRGGLFHELCATGRAHELQRIHRFTHEWEAAASLKLRRGDPAGWDPYLEHGRVIPGRFEEHLTNIAFRWIQATETGGSVSVVASTNEHVDQLNAAIQALRVHAGALDSSFSAPIAGGERVMIGDQIVTRRNDRRITTSSGEPIRNREQWTVTHIGGDGALAVTARHGHEVAVLPADYVREHVRLGYAATEHGVQGDTTTIGLELLSSATTRRGAYVGITRGRDDNTVYVVTDSNDLDEARDVLERVISVDRADVPATTQRRTLATAERAPHRPTPRCEIPTWLPTLRADIVRELDDLEHRARDAGNKFRGLETQLADAEHDLAAARRRLEPHQPAIDQAAADTTAAQQRVRTAYRHTQQAGRLHRRSSARDQRAAEADLAAAQQREADIRAVAAPATDAVSEARRRVDTLRGSLSSERAFLEWDTAPEQIQQHRSLRNALDLWEHWAEGKPLHTDRIAGMLDVLHTVPDAHRPECRVLATTVEQWAHTQGLDLTPARPTVVQRPTLDIGIEL